MALNEKVGAWGMFTKPESKVYDWKRDVYKHYRKTAEHIVKKQNISLFIDVHGAGAERPFGLDYDFLIPYKKVKMSLAEKILIRHFPHLFPAPHPNDNILEKILKNHMGERLPDYKITKGYFRPINGLGKRTLVYQIRKDFKIPAMQLEINRTLRRNDAHFETLVNALCEAVNEYWETKNI